MIINDKQIMNLMGCANNLRLILLEAYNSDPKQEIKDQFDFIKNLLAEIENQQSEEIK